ncbi:DJ-1/PfpI family protein [Spirillospora sp. NPDC047279]|uniref:DJ-1/PfpI family protein n=1 Tax=Spirillospora sp. NPDC047279 TaxID=3155478 RepID=UPI0033D4205E
MTHTTTYGLLIFEGADELDFVGPWEVFTTSSRARDDADTVVLIAERPDPVRCSKGMRVLPDHTLDDHPPLDVLLVPGGRVEAQMANPVVIDWIKRTAAEVNWVTSVCTGAFLLHEAGPARGRRVATDQEHQDELEARGGVTIVRDARYVVDGNLVTSQGVSAGIDMAVWLVGHLRGRDHARRVMYHLQYDPAPPYQADEPL